MSYGKLTVAVTPEFSAMNFMDVTIDSINSVFGIYGKKEMEFNFEDNTADFSITGSFTDHEEIMDEIQETADNSNVEVFIHFQKMEKKPSLFQKVFGFLSSIII